MQCQETPFAPQLQRNLPTRLFLDAQSLHTSYLGILLKTNALQHAQWNEGFFTLSPAKQTKTPSSSLYVMYKPTNTITNTQIMHKRTYTHTHTNNPPMHTLANEKKISKMGTEFRFLQVHVFLVHRVPTSLLGEGGRRSGLHALRPHSDLHPSPWLHDHDADRRLSRRRASGVVAGGRRPVGRRRPEDRSRG